MVLGTYYDSEAEADSESPSTTQNRSGSVSLSDDPLESDSESIFKVNQILVT